MRAFAALCPEIVGLDDASRSLAHCWVVLKSLYVFLAVRFVSV